MGGSAPQATPITLQAPRPPKPPPGYDFAKAFFQNVMPQLLNQQKPSYQGQVDPGLSPTMQHVLRGAQTFSQSPVPNSLEQSAGTLGKFQNFDKLPGADFQYQFDPSHQAMANFQRPALEMPTNPNAPPPNYGFQVPGMAEGGAGGYGTEKVVKMQSGGAGGMANAFLNTIGPIPGGDGYWYDQGNLAFNPNPAGGMLGNSRWGDFWNWAQGATGFTPGPQHGPNAQPWDATPPAGFDFGRGGTQNPVDLTNPRPTPYGWWSAEPGAPGSGFGVTPQNMPPWLRGLNDEQMAEVLRAGRVNPFMQGPGDMLGEEIVGPQSMDWGGPSGGMGGGGQGRGGGGGGGMNLSFQGLPGYNPTQVQPEFVAWDPGNPVPAMEAGRNIMPPFMAPPMPAPPVAGPFPPSGPPAGGGGGGGGGRPRPPQGPPPAAAGPPMGTPQMPLPHFFGPGGFGGVGAAGGGMNPATAMGTGNEVALPFFAEGNVVDHPQLAMIGEAGPEVVLPLTRDAADPRLRRMQDQLGLPAKPMQAGGAGGLGRKPWELPGRTSGPGLQGPGLQGKPQITTLPFPAPGGPERTTGPGLQGGPANALATKPAPVLPGRTSGPGIQGPGGMEGFVSPGLKGKPAKPDPSGMMPPPAGGQGLTTKPAPGPLPPSAPPPSVTTLPAPAPPGGPPAGGAPGPQAGPFGPTSAMDVYRSMVPVMNQAMDDAISRSSAAAGMTGNRFGTSTERNAMDIARRGALEQNQLMGNLLYGQTQQDLNRSLQATGMGLEDARFRNQLSFQGGQNALDRALQSANMGQSGAALQHQMEQDKLRLPFQIGSWEQGRQDQYAMLPYQEFQQNSLGFLPEIMQMISGIGGTGGMSGQFGSQQTAGSPGFLDYASAFAPYLALFMKEGGAAGYDTRRALGGY